MKHIGVTAFGIIGLFVVLIGFSIELARTYTINQLSWLETSGCTLPCWHGITPGVTSFPEALNLIHNIPEVDQTSISGRSEDTTTWLWFVYRTGDHHIYVELDGQISAQIRSIWFYPARAGNTLTIRLADLNARFGPPQTISALSANNSLLHLTYRYLGIEAILFIPGGASGRAGCNRLQMSAGLYLGTAFKRAFEDQWHGFTARFNQACAHAP